VVWAFRVAVDGETTLDLSVVCSVAIGADPRTHLVHGACSTSTLTAPRSTVAARVRTSAGVSPQASSIPPTRLVTAAGRSGTVAAPMPSTHLVVPKRPSGGLQSVAQTDQFRPDGHPPRKERNSNVNRQRCDRRQLPASTCSTSRSWYSVDGLEWCGPCRRQPDSSTKSPLSTPTSIELVKVNNVDDNMEIPAAKYKITFGSRR
jgi:hypothetical protein